MNTAHQAYRKSARTALTRVDMLVSLYDTTLTTITIGMAALEVGDDYQFELERIHAYRCLTALLEGIDADRDEIAQNIHRLCDYCIRLVLSRKLENWQAAQRILQPLHLSFQKIREKAVELELKGEIPPLQFGGVHDHATA